MYSLKKYPHVAVLMCTFNGEQFLEEQLDSIYKQDYKNWTLYVSDDGSKDSTLNILKSYQKKWGNQKLHIRRGPQKGFCQNFLQIINDPKIKADFYILSDQDDVWMSHKVSHAIKKLSKLNPLKPNLYSARTTYISSDAKRVLGQSDLFLKPPSFRNAIVQSIAGGNTMAFNNPLKKIAQKYLKAPVVSHDWWLYILNELVGGTTLYDSESTILYRQHSHSLIGANTGFHAKIKRLRMLLNGIYREYNSKHYVAFNKFYMVGLRRNLEIIDRFYALRDKSLKDRLLIIKELGIYRQTFETQMGLYLGLILKKI